MTPISESIGMTPSAIIDRLMLDAGESDPLISDQEGAMPQAVLPVAARVPLEIHKTQDNGPRPSLNEEQLKVRVGEELPNEQHIPESEEAKALPTPESENVPQSLAEAQKEEVLYLPMQASTRPWRKANKGWKDGRYYKVYLRALNNPVAYRSKRSEATERRT